MKIVIRSDKPESYIAIFNDNQEIAVKKWQSGRELSTQILSVIDELLNIAKIKPRNLTGVIVYEGPGSYTGLRIGTSVANAIGYSEQIPVFAVGGEDWIKEGQVKLKETSIFVPVSPVYGGQVFTTKPRK